jgi:multidrug efflux pump subunit AcrA (membrane-fusion protein)
MVSRLVDIGDHVHAGQVLATLESQTGTNELASASADVESAKAAEQVALLNLNRMQKLLPSGAIARTQLDTRALTGNRRHRALKAAWPRCAMRRITLPGQN